MYNITFKPRLYQETIFHTCSQKNTLVVLPTGLGKTNIFVMLAVQRLNIYPNSKVVLLGPTKPLVDQYLKVFLSSTDIPEEEMTVLTGKISPENREKLWEEKKVIFSTPQGLENDILTSRISLSDVSLLGFDEAHRAVGDYSYVWIAKQYHETSRFSRIIAMTASPGSDLEKIQEICNNLYIEAIEVRTDEDPDVKPYIKEKKIKWIYIDLPENFEKAKTFLEKSYLSKLEKVSEFGLLEKGKIKDLRKKELLGLQADIRKEVSQGDKSFENLQALSLLAEAMKIEHAIELLETQDISSVKTYFDKLYQEALKTNTKASKNLFKDPYFNSAHHLIELMYENGEKHPKLDKLKELIQEIKGKEPEAKIIIFTQYRDSVSKIIEEIKDLIKVKSFVGQAKKNGLGLSQKEQKEIIEKFSQGEFQALVATSVAEEGLDLPSVDYVIFYEPVPSAIRFIQRKGRTGRHDIGHIYIFVARKTRDEAYRWSAYHKERRMYRTLKDIKKNLKKISLNQSSESKNNVSLKNFIDNNNKEVQKKVKIIADYREKASPVIKALFSNPDIELEMTNLEIGDYVLSEDVCIEFKTKEDFLTSLIDNRLFTQVKNLTSKYKKPLLIVQGTEDLFSLRNINENSIRGLIVSLAIDYRLPIIFTKNPKDTAEYLFLIAKNEQLNLNKSIALHTKKPRTIKEIQEYIVSSLPNIGSTLSKPILTHFKTIRNLANSNIDDLLKIENIGPEKAKTIYDIFNSEYKTSKKENEIKKE
ncbi:MAG: hypothetical protein PWP03_325 [Candidatus Woesearchaeota archaeon]|nr:hypothetical protein [Candidatus Woesearchaeota archaeon]MDN5327687.1 hypothetical protein [Candidatus Woesearchaeota archaeon]